MAAGDDMSRSSVRSTHLESRKKEQELISARFELHQLHYNGRDSQELQNVQLNSENFLQKPISTTNTTTSWYEKPAFSVARGRVAWILRQKSEIFHRTPTGVSHPRGISTRKFLMPACFPQIQCSLLHLSYSVPTSFLRASITEAKLFSLF